jgi:DNA-directed RNA polymerase specialized sigma24 family protein
MPKPRRKIRFEVIPDPLPPPVTAEEARALAACVILGDKCAREALICGCLRLVADIVGGLLYSEHDRLYGLGGDDLYGIGCGELCKAVDSLKRTKSPQAYLRACVAGAIRDALTANAKRAMPPLSDFVPDWKESPFPERAAAPPLNDHEVEFVIDEYGEQALYKQYLRLRRYGATIKEAAEKIGRPKSSMGDWERRWVAQISEFFAASRRFQ